MSPPLQTDGDCEADGAADGDVVEGVEQLREHQRIQAAVQRHWPGEHWNTDVNMRDRFFINCGLLPFKQI